MFNYFDKTISFYFTRTVDIAPKATLPESSMRHVTSPTPDSEALIVIEFDMIAANSPSNTNSEGPLNTANLQFNNLDIIGIISQNFLI